MLSPKWQKDELQRSPTSEFYKSSECKEWIWQKRKKKQHKRKSANFRTIHFSATDGGVKFSLIRNSEEKRKV